MTEHQRDQNQADNQTGSLCQRCGRPASSAGVSSLTQWIYVCNCANEADLKESPPVKLCQICGKRINAGRVGSLTQWIFREDTCKCDLANLSGANDGDKNPFDYKSAVRMESDQQASFELELEPPVDFLSTERYKALSVLGTGASGTVFLCYDRLLDRKVAVKILRFVSKEQIVDFQSEAITASKLSHANIVKILDFGADERGTPYMVMDFIDGISLQKQIQTNGPLSVSEALQMARQICQALSHAHRSGVLHRDVKSSNILLSRSEPFNAILIDFGVAHFKERRSGKGASSGNTIVGSPSYMPPDQSKGLAYDERSEIYSSACVIFEALTGVPPFLGETALETMSLHAHTPAPPLSAIKNDGDFPESLEIILSKCLEKDPDDRLQTMEELDEALAEVKLQTELKARSGQTGLLERTLPLPIVPEPQAPSSELSSINRRLLTIIGLPAALLLAFVAFSMLDGKKTPKPGMTFRESPSEPEDYNSSDRVKVLKSKLKSTPHELILNGGLLKDEDLKCLLGNNELSVVDLSLNPITDRGTSYLTSKRLRVLRLNDCDVVTLEHIAGMDSLVELELNYSKINDASLQNLLKLPCLSLLSIDGTNVSEAGVEKLKKIRTLKYISLRNAKISKAFIKKFKEDMPDCAVGLKTFTPSYLGELILKRDQEIKAGRLAEAMQCNQECIQTLIRAQGPDAPLLVEHLLNNAQLCQILGKKIEREKLAERALAIARDSGNKRLVSMGVRSLRDYALADNHLDKAQFYQRECLAIDEQIEFLDGEQNIDDEITGGYIYTCLNQVNQAREILEKALNSSEKINDQRRSGIVLFQIGQIELLSKNINKAEERFLQAESLLAPLPVKNKAHAEVLRRVYRALSNNYEAKGEINIALDYARKEHRLIVSNQLDTCRADSEKELARLKSLDKEPEK